MADRQDMHEQLSAYLDGELDAQDAAAVEQALAADAALARELAELRLARESVRRLGQQKAPQDFTDRVLARAERMQLMQSGGKAEIRVHWLRHVAAAAVVLMVFSIVGSVGYSLYSTWRINKLQVAMQNEERKTQDLYHAYTTPSAESARKATSLGLALAEPAGGSNLVIYTDNLPKAQRQLEQVLTANAIVPAIQTTRSSATIAGTTTSAVEMARAANSFQAQRKGDEAVVYEVDVDDSQVTMVNKAVAGVQAMQEMPELATKTEGRRWEKVSPEAGATFGRTSKHAATADKAKDADGYTIEANGVNQGRGAENRKLAPAAPAATAAPVAKAEAEVTENAIRAKDREAKSDRSAVSDMAGKPAAVPPATSGSGGGAMAKLAPAAGEGVVQDNKPAPPATGPSGRSEELFEQSAQAPPKENFRLNAGAQAQSQPAARFAQSQQWPESQQRSGSGGIAQQQIRNLQRVQITLYYRPANTQSRQQRITGKQQDPPRAFGVQGAPGEMGGVQARQAPARGAAERNLGDAAASGEAEQRSNIAADSTIATSPEPTTQPASQSAPGPASQPASSPSGG